MLNDCEFENLEDIESRLYSEIYHNIEKYQELDTSSAPTESTVEVEEMRKVPRSRYFQNNVIARKSLDQPKPTTKVLTSQLPVNKELQDNAPEVPFSPIMAELLSKGERIKLKKKRRRESRKERRLQLKKSLGRVNINLPTGTNKSAANAPIIPKQQKKSDQSSASGGGLIIALSDSEDESCTVIPKVCSVVSLVDSDDGESESVKVESHVNVDELLLDDVIFVANSPVEVINLDDDVVVSDKLEDVSNKVDDSDSVSSLSTSKSSNSPNKIDQESHSLLDTASNDFIDNSGIELSHSNFNFALHGREFDKGELFKPPQLNSRNDGESETTSSTTVDLNSLNSGVFNEPEFPKGSLFEEENLESFGNLITPIRKDKQQLVTEDNPKLDSDKQQNFYTSSETSEESDFEGVQVVSTPTTSRIKSLPTLSHIEVKNHKKSNLNSKFDLINGTNNIETARKSKKLKVVELSELEIVMSNKKKSKKSKKKREKSIVLIEYDKDECETPKVKNKKKSEIADEALKEDLETDAKKVKNRKRIGEVIAESLEDVSDESPRKSKNRRKSNDNQQPIDNDNVKSLDAATSSVKSFNLSGLNSETKNGDREAKEEVVEEASDDEQLEPSDETGVPDDAAPSVQIKDSTIELFDSDSNLSELKGDDSDIQLLNCSQPLLHRLKVATESNRIGASFDLLNSTVYELQSKMSDDPTQWRVLDSDRLHLRTKGTGRRCNRCREVGHPAIKCPNKVSPKCNLCGNSGHFELRCPNKICTGCGRNQGYTSTYCKHCFAFRHQECKTCRTQGHVSQFCPDLWRRYHLTTEEGPLIKYQGPACKPRHQLWCSGCAKSGHLVHECRVFINADYPKSDPFIRSYQDIYGFDLDISGGEPQIRNISFPSSFQSPLYMRTNTNIQQNFYFNQNSQYNNQYVNFYNEPHFDNIINGNSPLNFESNQILAPRYMNNGLMVNHNATFHETLPDYLTFDSNVDKSQHYNKSDGENIQNLTSAEKRQQRYAHHISVTFFKKNVQNIQQLILMELKKLAKYSENLKGILGDLRRHMDNPGPSYRNLNMVLFGIFGLQQGQMHLEKLKSFRSIHPRTMLNGTKRKDLYISYCYIFGSERHSGDVNYKELLLTVI